MEETKDPQTDKVMNAFEEKKSFFSGKLIIILIVVAILGVGSGYLLSKRGTTKDLSLTSQSSSKPKAGTVVGSNDLKTFKDTAEGVLKKGGIDGEGQFHLERPGGESQNVYLTSSIVDLSKFVGGKVKVWGETNNAQRAGWLMDVGRVEVL